MCRIFFSDWFRRKYPGLASNLATNANRLTTPFDVYETLQHILDADWPTLEEEAGRKMKGRSRGYSLFEKIPEERSCEDAEILPHW